MWYVFNNLKVRAHNLSALQRVDISLILSAANVKNKIFDAIKSKNIQMLFLIW